MTQPTDLTGQILAAMPGMEDPRFAQSLVLVCSHSPEGAMGLIINRPLPKLRFAQLLDQLDIDHGADVTDLPVQFGGPVEPGRGFVLHGANADDTAEGRIRIAPDLEMTVTRDVLADLACGEGPSPAILVLGYSGWSAGQLENEIQANGWLAAPLTQSLVFDTDHATKWARALWGMGINPALLSPTAGHA